MAGEPLLLHVERRRQHQNVRILGLEQIGRREFGHHERASRIDLVHEIEALHLGRLAVCQRDRARIVDDDVDAAKMVRGFIQSVAHGRLIAHVDNDRQSIAASGLDLFGGGVDRAGQFWIDLGGLGGDGDVGAVARRAQADGETDAARRAGDKQRFSLERTAPTLRPSRTIRIDVRQRPKFNAAPTMSAASAKSQVPFNSTIDPSPAQMEGARAADGAPSHTVRNSTKTGWRRLSFDGARLSRAKAAQFQPRTAGRGSRTARRRGNPRVNFDRARAQLRGQASRTIMARHSSTRSRRRHARVRSSGSGRIRI